MNLSKFDGKLYPRYKMRCVPLSVFFAASFLSLSFQSVQAVELLPYYNQEMGVQLKYPANWDVGLSSFLVNPHCQMRPCYQDFGFMNDTVGFTVTMEIIEYSECKCRTLLEYVQWHYNFLTDNSGFNFISDNQTVLAGYPSHVIKYQTTEVGSIIGSLPGFSPFQVTEVITATEDAFYVFKYYGKEKYSKHLQDFDDMLKSVVFYPVEVSKPSFLK